MPMSIKVTVKVYHCANCDGPFGGRLGSEPILSINVNLVVTLMDTGMETVCVNGPLILLIL